jgi:flagellar motor switch protein FliN/FliY
MNRLLRQEEIDALLSADKAEPEQSELMDLSAEEKDALGEIGNICMGSAATSLSLLINRKVVITSPEVRIRAPEDIFRDFPFPFINIGVDFTEGLYGNNFLLMKTADAALVANLMMGETEATDSETEKLSELQISATSEAMNQMISSAATAMASMFEQKIGISPPRINVVEEGVEHPDLFNGGSVVVISFHMTIEGVLDSQILQVMGLDAARAQSALILNRFSENSRLSGEKGMAQGEMQEEMPEEMPEETVGLADQGRAASKTEPVPQAEGTEYQVHGLEQKKMNLILDIPLNVTVVLGRTRRPVREVLKLTPGAVVELAEMVDEPVEVLVNGTLVARGEVVVVNENFGVRITSIISPVERVQYLSNKTMM